MANKDASDFMLQEYDQIAQAYFKLGEQLNQWFRNYLSLVALPLTVLGAILQLSRDGELPKLTELPELVAGLLLVIGLLGFLVMIVIIFTRMEMVMYARTINKVREYFAKLDEADHKASGPDGQATGTDHNQTPGTEQPLLGKYLVLPVTDEFPPFYEGNHSVLMMVFIIGIVNGLIFSLGVINFLGWPLPSVLIGVIISAALHWVTYRLFAGWRSRNWQRGGSIPSYKSETLSLNSPTSKPEGQS